VDIGHHRRKWKSPILGVARIVLCDVFLASIFLAYVEPKPFFFRFCAGKFSSAAPNSGSNMMILMLSMQMQQQTQQFSMHQQMFQQQMQMQMAAMEKRAETSEKYLRRIAKTIGRNKRKRGGYDDEDNRTDDDE
jgi:hypothetical protein